MIIKPGDFTRIFAMHRYIPQSAKNRNALRDLIRGAFIEKAGELNADYGAEITGSWILLTCV
jgi:hypothetical protein